MVVAVCGGGCMWWWLYVVVAVCGSTYIVILCSDLCVLGEGGACVYVHMYPICINYCTPCNYACDFIIY